MPHNASPLQVGGIPSCGGGHFPENRLETLGGDRVGQRSIRVNDQWRICFRWVEPDALGVEIVDYH
jgi:plasmid maintenance system killer protein